MKLLAPGFDEAQQRAMYETGVAKWRKGLWAIPDGVGAEAIAPSRGRDHAITSVRRLEKRHGQMHPQQGSLRRSTCSRRSSGMRWRSFGLIDVAEAVVDDEPPHPKRIRNSHFF